MPVETDNWDRMWELFHEALERSPEQREAFLTGACGDAPELRREVEELLAAHDHPEVSLEPPDAPGGLAPTATNVTEAPTAPTHIGRYEIRRVIASGGMGTVYEAVQDHPRRVVALKVMRHEAASTQAMKRFQHEAEILGRLRHPHIAQIYDAGTFDKGEGAQPYFAMEYVRGRPLLQHCDAQGVGTRERLQLSAKVCDAVQYAHHRGIIHRDLKPDNILVDDFGEPKILDFGVARATGSDIQVTTLRTDIGQLIGTVPYMSPEQVTGDPDELDTRSDIYSLGVLLYELLCGRLPYQLLEKNIPDAVRVIREEDPTPLSSVNRVFRGDLDTIVAKALEKEKDRRYQTAAELAADLRHYLADEPIVARPASTFYQLRKFARRNKTIVGATAAIFLVLIAGVAVSSVLALGQTRARARAEMINEFLEDILTSANPYQGERDLTIAELLDEAAAEIDTRFADHPEIAVGLHVTVSEAYFQRGKYSEAETHARTAYDSGMSNLGPHHPETLDALERLVIFFQDRAAGVDEGVVLGRQLVTGCREVYGPSHPRTLRAMMYLLTVLRSSVDGLAEAAELSAEIRRIKHGDDSGPGSNVLMRQYKYQEALQIAQAALDAKPERGLDAAELMSEVALLRGLTGNPAEGAALAKAACEVRIAELAPGDREISVSLYTAGVVHQWMGDLEEAQRYFELYLTGQQHASSDHFHALVMARFLLSRVQLLTEQVKPQEALPDFEKAVRAYTDPMRSHLGEMSLTAYASCLVQLGRYAEAEAQMLRHPEDMMSALPAHHYERRLHLRTLAEIYEGLGQPEKAAAYRALLREGESADETSE
jgi:tetratricopeptide (TPR) repeat protein/predicted Ser/Thr protein kinase